MKVGGQKRQRDFKMRKFVEIERWGFGFIRSKHIKERVKEKRNEKIGRF